MDIIEEKFHFHHLWEVRVKTIGFPPSCDEYLKRSESLVIDRPA